MSVGKGVESIASTVKDGEGPASIERVGVGDAAEGGTKADEVEERPDDDASGDGVREGEGEKAEGRPSMRGESSKAGGGVSSSPERRRESMERRMVEGP